jgi:predicted  nucleic acid-binding Zn-ribbon protein
LIVIVLGSTNTGDFENEDEDEDEIQHNNYDHEPLEMQQERHAAGPERNRRGRSPTSGIVRFLAQPRRRLGVADRGCVMGCVMPPLGVSFAQYNRDGSDSIDMQTVSTPNSKPIAPTATTAPKRAWRIRSDKGEVFGPADLDTLKAWARDGRIAPTSELSENGTTWLPVTNVIELEMDWVAEVTSGTFYGPVHRAALDELIRDNALGAGASLFKRFDPDAAIPPSPRERELEDRLHSAQQTLFARIGELESLLSACRSELDQAQASLRARDLEFDAERQELRAAANRLQAELVKRDGRIGALEKESARQEQAGKDRHTVESRLSEAEKQLADVSRERDLDRRHLEQARQIQRDAEKNAAALRERQAACQRELDAARETGSALRLRLDSIRKLLQQAAGAAGAADEARESTVIDIETSESQAAGAPPVTTAPGAAKPGLSLVDLEAQAQRELRQLRQAGGKGGPLGRNAPTR